MGWNERTEHYYKIFTTFFFLLNDSAIIKRAKWKCVYVYDLLDEGMMMLLYKLF